jgi:hypothetical protein
MLKKLNQSTFSNLVGQNFDVNLVVLQFDLSMLYIILPIELRADSLLCSKSIVVLLLLLFVIMHLIIDLLLSGLMIATLM